MVLSFFFFLVGILQMKLLTATVHIMIWHITALISIQKVPSSKLHQETD